MQDKMWIVEADLRTVLTNGAGELPYRFDTGTINTTCEVLTRYIWTTAMNGNGMYCEFQFKCQNILEFSIENAEKEWRIAPEK